MKNISSRSNSRRLQNYNKKQKIAKNDFGLLELGLLLPILYFAAIANIYYYELGYFSSYDIPAELIKVEVEKNIPLIFILLSSVGFILTYSIGISLYLKKNKIWTWVIPILGLTIWLIYFVNDINSALRMVPLILAYCFVYLSKLYDSSEKFKAYISELPYISHFFKLMYSWTSSIALYLITFCLLSFLIGYISASTKETIYDQKEAIRRYDSYSIYRQLVFNGKSFEVKIYVTDSKSDTLTIKKGD